MSSNSRKKQTLDPISLLLIILLVVLAAVTGKSMLDRLKLASEIQSTNQEMRQYKHDFAKLRQQNPDICGWITLEHTNIDYPVVQGSNNLEYLNRNAFGETAIYGAIFEDYRNSSNFTDPYTIIYGHHMSSGLMFGDIDRYRKPSFFRKYRHGWLYTPNRKYRLTTIALIRVSCDSTLIYDPEKWNTSSGEILAEFTRSHTINKSNKLLRWISEKKDGSHMHLLALSTCEGSQKDLRSVLILAMSKP